MLASLVKITPTLPTVRVIYSIINMVRMIGDNIKLPEDWTQIVKVIKKREKKIIQGILTIPDKIDMLAKHRPEILKMKKQWFGKGKICLTAISSSFQKESRMFANYFALVILALKELKIQSKQNMNMNTAPSIGNITPLKIEINKDIDISESSNYNESEDPMPRESADETNSYYNKSKNTLSSADPTPEQKKIKKSPVKCKKREKTPTKKNFVKGGYLSSDNQSTGSGRRIKNFEENKFSPSKRLLHAKNKKIPQAVKRTVNLKVSRSDRNQTLLAKSSNKKHKFKHSLTEKQSFDTKNDK